MAAAETAKLRKTFLANNFNVRSIVSVPVTFFDGKTEKEKFSLDLPTSVSRLYGEIIKLYVRSARVRFFWDNAECDITKCSLTEVTDDAEITIAKKLTADNTFSDQSTESEEMRTDEINLNAGSSQMKSPVHENFEDDVEDVANIQNTYWSSDSDNENKSTDVDANVSHDSDPEFIPKRKKRTRRAKVVPCMSDSDDDSINGTVQNVIHVESNSTDDTSVSSAPPCNDTASTSAVEAPQTGDTDEPLLSFIQGEEGQLFYKQLLIFNEGAYETNEHLLGKSRFRTIKVYKNAAYWPDFNPEVHIAGERVTWKIKSKTLNAKKLSENTVASFNRNITTTSTTPKENAQREKKRNPEKWNYNVQKKARNSGKEYSYWSKANKTVKTRPARAVQEKPCNQHCKSNCESHFSLEDRQLAHSDYWSLPNDDSKRLYLSSLITLKDVATHRPRQGVPNSKKRNRARTYHYHLNKPDADPIRVCPDFIYNTFDISRKVARTSLAKRSSTGGIAPDLRGSHILNMLKDYDVQGVVGHVCEFKTMEAHYVRSREKSQFLPSTLSISEMYRMYIRWCQAQNRTPVKESAYRTILREKFNLKFQKPMNDRCDFCDGLENIAESDMDSDFAAEKKIHEEEKRLCFKLKEDMKLRAQMDEKFAIAAFDFEKTLLSPSARSSAFYYIRRLKVFNFTIADISSLKHASCYLWSEEQAGKGSNEVASCLIDYLKTLQQKGITHVFLMADRCGGQNCNRMVLIALSLALSWFDFESITLSFFITGHSYNENDTVHSIIEREAQRLSTFTLDNWETVIKSSLTKADPMREIDMNHVKYSDIKNFKPNDHQQLDMYKGIFKQGYADENKNVVKWSKIIQAKFVKEDPEVMLIKYRYSESEFAKVNLIQKKRRSGRVRPSLKDDLPTYKDLPQVYDQPPGVLQKKYDDLVKLCDKTPPLIPLHHQNFYRSLHIKGDEYDSAESDAA